MPTHVHAVPTPQPGILARILVLCLIATACQPDQLTSVTHGREQLAVTTTSQEDEPYSVTDLGVLPLGVGSAAEDVNEAGDVAGWGDSGWTFHAAVWRSKTLFDLGVPAGYAGTEAFALNDIGDVVGVAINMLADDLFMWNAADGFRILVGLPGLQPFPRAVNNRREVVGTFWSPLGAFHAFLWTPLRGFVDLTPPGTVGSDASDISESGIIVGNIDVSPTESRAVMWDATLKMTELGTLGGRRSIATGINGRREIVGAGYDAVGVTRPFLWTPDRGMRGFSVIGGGTDISNAGRAVGNKGVGFPYTAVSWTASGGFVALPRLWSGASTRATAVNRCGTIAGVSDVPSGNQHAIRWTKPTCD